MKGPTLGEMRHSIQVVRRRTTIPDVYSAEVDHEYTPVLTTQAACKTRGGVAEFNRVVINGTPATHTFTIRYTKIPIDVQDRLQDAERNLYSILGVENRDMRYAWIDIHCARVGSLDRQSVT